MTLVALLQTLDTIGVVLIEEGDDLHCEAPLGVMNSELLDTLRQHKQELQEYLRRNSRPSSPPLVEDESIPCPAPGAWSKIELLLPADTPLPVPAGRWRRIEDGRILATYTPMELELAVVAASASDYAAPVPPTRELDSDTRTISSSPKSSKSPRWIKRW